MAERRLNVILFVPETIRGDAVFGDPGGRAKTPALDAFRSEAVAFTHCFAQNPFCTPSRCSFLTGLYPHTHGHRSLLHLLHAHERNLLRDLKEGGYYTAVFGKNDVLAPDAVPAALDEWKPRVLPRDRPRHHSPPDRRWEAGFYLGKRDPSPCHDADAAFLDSALDVIAHPPREPFCLFLPLHFAHPAYTVEEPWFSLHDRDAVSPPYPPRFEGKDPYYRLYYERSGLAELTPADLREIRSVYWGMISRVDHLFGRLIEGLQKHGLWDRTALFFFSDHGDFAGDYGLVEKWNCGTEDCLLHVPLLFRVPGRSPAGLVRDGVVELLDLYATVLDAAGVPSGHSHFSRSLLPDHPGAFLPEGRDAAFSHSGHSIHETQCLTPQTLVKGSWYERRNGLLHDRPDLRTRRVTLRTRRYRYVYWPEGLEQLYDLEDDPGALVNHASEAAYAPLLREFRERILRHLLETSDTTPLAPDPRAFPS